MISSFSQYLVEEERSVYFTFGRMNPPTVGHGKLLDALATKSGRNPYKVFLSQSQDAKKNPLSYSDKVKHVRKMFPKHARSVMINNKIRTAIDAAVDLYNQGFRSVVMVVGSDRVTEFEVLLSKYNGKDARHGFYNFKSIKVISAGERDPDAEGVEGMSASKMRGFASDNDFVSFSQGLPSSMSSRDAKKLFNDVRTGMGLREEREFKNHIQLAPVSDIREAFVNNNLFQEGEQVVMTKNGVVGTIKHLGANYLIVESKGETWRCWLDQVDKVDPESDTRRNPIIVDAPYQPPGDAGLSSVTMLGESVATDDAVNTTKPKLDKYLKRRTGTDKKPTKVSITFEADQPEWGTPESTKKAKKITPNEATDPVDATRDKIAREKEQDAKRHDQMLDRARLALAKQKNRGTSIRPEIKK